MSRGKGIGDRFQAETKYARYGMPEHGLDWVSRPESVKQYAAVERITLPEPVVRGTSSLWELLRQRRSVRSYGGDPLRLEEISALLWAAQGVTKKSRGFLFRTAPSAGALYPIETYVAAHDVEGLSPGIYHYRVGDHSLELLTSGDTRSQCARAALDQEIAFTANVVFVWTAIFSRSKWKYRQRAYRYIYLDAGHIAQNVALAAVDLGLGSCQIAAFYDDEVNELIGVSGTEESAVYMTAVGSLSD